MQLSKQDLENASGKVYDTLIVGGGAGGLSAGVYLQRFRLSSVIVDKGKARSFWIRELNNYLGLSPGTPGKELLQKGKKHYLSFEGDFLNGYVEDVQDEGEHFAVRVKVGRQQSVYPILRAKYLIVASGIIDHLPALEEMDNVYDYAGHSIYVCMVCDGYEMTDKRCGFFAGSEASIEEMVFNLSWFTPYITIFTHGAFEISAELRQRLQDHGYRLVETPIKQFLGQDHQVSGVELRDGTIVAIETGLISMGARYHHQYLDGLKLERKGGYLVTDRAGRTSHPRIFAIGDLKVGLNQVAVAVGDGAVAAAHIWREMRYPRKWEDNG